jgi:hypothetical protein
MFATNRTRLFPPSLLVLWDIDHTMIDTSGVGMAPGTRGGRRAQDRHVVRGRPQASGG